MSEEQQQGKAEVAAIGGEGLESIDIPRFIKGFYCNLLCNMFVSILYCLYISSGIFFFIAHEKLGQSAVAPWNGPIWVAHYWLDPNFTVAIWGFLICLFVMVASTVPGCISAYKMFKIDLVVLYASKNAIQSREVSRNASRRRWFYFPEKTRFRRIFLKIYFIVMWPTVTFAVLAVENRWKLGPDVFLKAFGAWNGPIWILRYWSDPDFMTASMGFWICLFINIFPYYRKFIKISNQFVVDKDALDAFRNSMQSCEDPSDLPGTGCTHMSEEQPPQGEAKVAAIIDGEGIEYLDRPHLRIWFYFRDKTLLWKISLRIYVILMWSTFAFALMAERYRSELGPDIVLEAFAAWNGPIWIFRYWRDPHFTEAIWGFLMCLFAMLFYNVRVHKQAYEMFMIDLAALYASRKSMQPYEGFIGVAMKKNAHMSEEERCQKNVVAIEEGVEYADRPQWTIWYYLRDKTLLWKNLVRVYVVFMWPTFTYAFIAEDYRLQLGPGVSLEAFFAWNGPIWVFHYWHDSDFIKPLWGFFICLFVMILYNVLVHRHAYKKFMMVLAAFYASRGSRKRHSDNT